MTWWYWLVVAGAVLVALLLGVSGLVAVLSTDAERRDAAYRLFMVVWSTVTVLVEVLKSMFAKGNS